MGKKSESEAALPDAKRAKQEESSFVGSKDDNVEPGSQQAKNIFSNEGKVDDKDATPKRSLVTKSASKKTKVTLAGAFRRSSRIQQIDEKMKEVYSTSTTVLASVTLEKNSNEEPDCTEKTVEKVTVKVKQVKAKVTKLKVSELAQQEPQLASSYSAAQIDDPEAAQKVKETLKLFNTYFLRSVQGEESRCQSEATNENATEKKKHKKKEERNEPRKSRRPDLKAISQMRADGKILYKEKVWGHVRGIHVGDHFFSRCEMMAVGLHFHWLAGIDYLGAAHKKIMPNRTFPIATSLVLSGCYEDDVDNSADVVYTGQGGNDLLGKKHQIADQVMEKGNLALKNNMEQNLPVRLIRGNKTKKSYTGKVYTYDGLYKVQKYWAEKGVSGFTVFKFRLHRMEHQPVLTTEQVHFVSGQVPSNPSELTGLVCADLSNGSEAIPLPASNVVDATPSGPNFRYLARNEVDKNVPAPVPAKGCKCKGGCYDVSKCSCAALNGKKFPYVSLNGGRLVEALDVIYECGPDCECGSNCSNRVTQKGMRYRLEVFKTASKGWAVRSWDTIPSGAPVCEYTGILMKTDDADNIGNNEYLFEIDCLQTIRGIGERQRRRLTEEKASDSHDDLLNDVVDQPEYCIDAGTCGSVARFINHSCEPNLFVQCIVNEHHDLSQARVWLCAAETIHPLQELSYDYNYELDSVVKDGQVKVLPCYCGAHTCRKRLH